MVWKARCQAETGFRYYRIPRHIKPLFRKTAITKAGWQQELIPICKAIRGEYTRSGKTLAEQRAYAADRAQASKGSSDEDLLLVAVILGIAVAVLIYSRPDYNSRTSQNQCGFAIFGVSTFPSAGLFGLGARSRVGVHRVSRGAKTGFANQPTMFNCRCRVSWL